MSSEPPTRRDVLLTTASAGLAVMAGCAGPSPSPPAPVAGAASIDVHCHVFNVRDIPVRKFIRGVVLREYPLVGEGTAGLIELAEGIMELGAVSAETEAADLEGRPSGDRVLGSARELPSFDGDDAALVRDRVQRAVERLQSTIPLQPSDGRPASTVPMSPELRTFLLDAIRRSGASPAQEQGENKLQGTMAVSPSAAGLAIAGIGGEITGIARLASLLTLRRQKLADRLRALPRTGGGEVALFTPAMVDYGYWLDAEHDTTPLQQQVDVMSAMAAVKGRGYAVHAYVSFCPWRQLVEPDQMRIVREAVLERGCIGVKVYPVMGFLPHGNIAANSADYPGRLTGLGPNWATDLDAALAGLYDFCIANDVPILAHCSQSQDTSDKAGQRASPKAWNAVLADGRWKELRLDLGHFGGFWDLANPRSNGWTADAVDLMARCPNVFADIADHDKVVAQTPGQVANEKAILTELNDIFAARDGNRVARGKLMYGTDWVMLSRADGTPDYYPSMKAKFTADLGLTGPESRGFLGGNAARFLGLVPSGGAGSAPKTRQRLEAFYKAHGLDNSVLARWDGITP